MVKKYYWDTNVILSYIKGKGKGENRTDEEMMGIDGIVKEVEEGKAIIVTSALTFAEVYASKLDEEQKQRYNSILKRPSMPPIDAHSSINIKASEIREYYNDLKKKITTPDAIHLATAILTGVDALHTFDEDDLIPLSGDVMGHNLKICKPKTVQGIMGIKSIMGIKIEKKVEKK